MIIASFLLILNHIQRLHIKCYCTRVCHANTHILTVKVFDNFNLSILYFRNTLEAMWQKSDWKPLAIYTRTAVSNTS